MRSQKRKWIFSVLTVIVLVVAAYVFLKPRSLAVTDAVPSGVLVYARLDHLLDHLKSLRSSKFWVGISKINVPGFLEHEDVAPVKVARYIKWRNNISGMTNSPLFKQFLGREVAAALYPQFNDFSNGDWPIGFSGLLVIVRPDSGTRLTEVLGGVWNQYGKEWDSSIKRYKNIAITSVKFKSSGVSFFYARINDLLAVAVDERVLHNVIDVVKSRMGSIKQDEQFLLTAKHFYNAPNGEFLIDMPKTKEFLERYWSEIFEHPPDENESLTQAKMEELLKALNGIKTAGGAFLAGKPMRLKWVVSFDPAKSGPELNGLNVCPNVNNPTINMVPKDAIVYQWTNCLNFSSQYEKLKIHKQQASGQSVVIEMPFAGLEKAWGLSVQDDILPILGNEFGWFLQGIDVGGFFPIPKFVVFLKVNDQKKAQDILKKIVTTPLTLVQNEDYQKVRINFVTVPLVNAFKPSYAFVGGYLVLSTSDKLLKESIDVNQDPSTGLSAEAFFKQGGGVAMPGQMISFVKMGEIARQSKALVDWADHWFSLKIQQADADEAANRQKLQALTETIQAKDGELVSAKTRLDNLRREKMSLEAQVQAAAVVIESKNTLSQEGAVQEPSVPDEVRPEKLLEYKKSQVAAMELEVDGLSKDIEAMKARQPDLTDGLNDFENQKLDAQKFRYYIDDVVVPVLHGLEALSSQKMTMTVRDGVIESEIFLIVE